MKISTEQLNAVKALHGHVTPPESVVDKAVIKLMDADLVKSVTQAVEAMPDREDMIADLKARIDAGTYNVSSEEIVVAMARRANADRID